jgi:glycerol-3-phosphate acyltransferase PlsY
MLESISSILLRCLICFLLGSIPFAIVAMMGSGVDIRTMGSGNPGFNNVLRVSKPRAVLTLLGDTGKGFLAVWLVLRFWPIQDAWNVWRHADPIGLGWLYGLATVLGHCYSPFLKFNGGKGVATSGGVMLVLYPIWAAIAIIYFAVVRFTASRLKWNEAGMVASLTTWTVFVLLMLAFVGFRDATYAAIMTLFLAWRHRKNFQNLMRGPADSGLGAHKAVNG